MSFKTIRYHISAGFYGRFASLASSPLSWESSWSYSSPGGSNPGNYTSIAGRLSLRLASPFSLSGLSKFSWGAKGILPRWFRPWPDSTGPAPYYLRQGLSSCWSRLREFWLNPSPDPFAQPQQGTFRISIRLQTLPTPTICEKFTLFVLQILRENTNFLLIIRNPVLFRSSYQGKDQKGIPGIDLSISLGDRY